MIDEVVGLFIKKNPQTNHRFMLSVGSMSMSFSKISGIENSLEIETSKEGNNMNGNNFLVSPKSKLSVLTLEHGVHRSSNALKKLTLGTEIKDGNIIVLDGRLPTQMYSFDSGIVSSFKIMDLNAMEKKVLIRSLQITHTGLREINTLL